MKLKNQKISTYLLIGLAVVISLAGSTFFLLRRQPVPLDDHSYTLLSHNVADLQTNPVEYTSVLSMLSDTAVIEDTALCLAAERLLTIDTDEASYACRHEVLPLEKVLYKALKVFYEATAQESPNTKSIKKEAEDFLFEHLHQPNAKSYALSLDEDSLRVFDKGIRQRGGTRFSPLFYDQKFLLWLQHNLEEFDLEAFTNHWVESMRPHLKVLYKQAIEQKSDIKALRQAYLFTYLFDLHSLKRLFEHEGVEAWVKLVTKLQKSALGDAKRRNERLVALYEATNPAIICLQECDLLLIQALTQKGYYTPPKQDEEGSKTVEKGSVILYKKSFFEADDITVLQLDPKNATQVDPHEVALHKVDHKDMVWLVASFHATSSGDNTLAFLEALFALQKRLEEEEGKKVLLLLGIDANTSEDPALIKAGLKQDLQQVDRLLAEHKEVYTRILYEGQDTSTVNKERSTFQAQRRKTHVLTNGISDFILVSHEASAPGKRKAWRLTPQKVYLSPFGPHPETNPSDHRAIAFTFILEGAEKSKQDA